MGELFDKFDSPDPTGREIRDAKLKQVLDNAGDDWKDQVACFVKENMSGEITGEDIRLRCAEAGIFPPHHNAWGAMINILVRGGVLIKTGKYRQMKDPRSHARETKTYLVVLV